VEKRLGRPFLAGTLPLVNPRWLLLLALAVSPATAQTPWPAQAAAAPVVLQVTADDAKARDFAWESARFAIRSDLRLPAGIVRDFAAVFEATQDALAAVPLGLAHEREGGKHPVRLCATTETYKTAGGPPGTGGYFNGREMLVLLPNLGIQPTANGLSAEHQKKLFIIKHEVTHEILQSWNWPLPPWLNEGLAECVASWPYTTGRYSFANLDAAMRAYVLKWRKPNDRQPLRILAPRPLMALSAAEWQREVETQNAYDHYNSAALLTHYFLRHDDRGDGAHLAACLADLHRGIPHERAEAEHLLRGRTPEQLAAELKALARRMALEIAVEN
jgi:hypothetical protein